MWRNACQSPRPVRLHELFSVGRRRVASSVGADHVLMTSLLYCSYRVLYVASAFLGIYCLVIPHSASKSVVVCDIIVIVPPEARRTSWFFPSDRALVYSSEVRMSDWSIEGVAICTECCGSNKVTRAAQ